MNKLYIAGFSLMLVGATTFGLTRLFLSERVGFAKTQFIGNSISMNTPEVVSAPEVQEPRVITIDPVVITGSRRRAKAMGAPAPITTAASAPEEPVDLTGDPLQAEANHWDCRVFDSAFGGRVRSCGPREK